MHLLTLLEIRILIIAQQIILLMLEMTFGTVTSEMLSEKRASRMAVKTALLTAQLAILPTTLLLSIPLKALSISLQAARLRYVPRLALNRFKSLRLAGEVVGATWAMPRLPAYHSAGMVLGRRVGPLVRIYLGKE